MSLLSMVNYVNIDCPGLNPAIVKSVLNDSYRALCRMDWYALRPRAYNIHTIAPYSTGTVSITSGGIATVTGGTFTTAMDGRWIRVYYNDSFFKVSIPSGSVVASLGEEGVYSVVIPTTTVAYLTIEDWPGAVVTNSTYSIFQNDYACPTELSPIYDIAYQTSLAKKPMGWFNRVDPSRLTYGEPLMWSALSFSEDDGTVIEVYPVPDGVYPLRVYGKVRYVRMGDTSSPLLPEDLIRAHAMPRLFTLKSKLDPKGGWAEMATGAKQTYTEMLNDAQELDMSSGDGPDKVKDTFFGSPNYPASDTFAAAHDVEL